MQINNINGSVIIIDEIYVNRNRVDYTLYEYGGSSITRRKSHPFSTITLTDYLTVETNFETLCYDTLIAEVDNDYSVSEDTQHWVIAQNSSAEDTVVRVYIPANTINRVLHTDNDLDGLLQQLKPLVDLWIRLDNGIHAYLVNLSANNRAILETYPEIIIEDKV